MKTRIIYTKIWKDDYFASLNAKEKLFFIYIISNERVNLCGIYELSEREVKFDLDLSDKDISLLKQKFCQDNKFFFKDGWVKINNYSKYNNYTGVLNDTAKERELSTIPQEIQDLEYCIDSVSGFSNTLNNHKSVINNKKSEIRKELISDDQKQELVRILVSKGLDEKFVSEELNKFISYWTELNPSRTKQRWQMEKTFEVNKRLTTWFNNIKKFSGGVNDRVIIG